MEGGDGAGYGRVEFAAFDVFGADLCGGDVIQADSCGDGAGDLYFLAYAVDEVEFGVREKDGQRDTGEAATGADIDHFHVRLEVEGGGNREGMKDMLLIQTVDVSPRDDVNFCIPFFVELVQG